MRNVPPPERPWARFKFCVPWICNVALGSIVKEDAPSDDMPPKLSVPLKTSTAPNEATMPAPACESNCCVPAPFMKTFNAPLTVCRPPV